MLRIDNIAVMGFFIMFMIAKENTNIFFVIASIICALIGAFMPIDEL